MKTRNISSKHETASASRATKSRTARESELMAMRKADLASLVMTHEQRISNLLAFYHLARREGGLLGPAAETLESARLKRNWEPFERALESARRDVAHLRCAALAGSQILPIAYRCGQLGLPQPGSPSAAACGRLQQVAAALDRVREALLRSRPFLGHAIHSRGQSSDRANAGAD